MSPGKGHNSGDTEVGGIAVQRLRSIIERVERPRACARALEIVAIRRRQAERADKELEIAELMYREGMGSQLDLINAQETDQKSRTELLSAVQELWLVLAEADRVMGRWASR